METIRVRSLSLPLGVNVPHFTDLKEALASVKGDQAKILEVINKYGRQKDSLVNARSYLSDTVADSLKFARLTKKGEAVTDKTEATDIETESDHLNRAVAAAIAGQWTPPGLTIPAPVAGAKPEDVEAAAEAAVWSFFQSIIDASPAEGGFKTGEFPFDLNATARVGKKKKIAPWAINAARTIITNGSQAKWVTQFTNGYTDRAKVAHPPVAFAPFDVKAADGQDPVAVENSNVENLARAIEIDEENRKAASAGVNYA
jgi:hypothetical protein